MHREILGQLQARTDGAPRLVLLLIQQSQT